MYITWIDNIVTSWTEVREFEFNSDSDEVNLFQLGVYRHYVDSNDGGLYPSIGLPAYLPKLGENALSCSFPEVLAASKMILICDAYYCICLSRLEIMSSWKTFAEFSHYWILRFSCCYSSKIWRPPRKSGLTPKTTKARVVCNGIIQLPLHS